MRIASQKIPRRSLLMGGALAVLAWVSRPLLGSVKAQQSPSIFATPVDRAPTDPGDSLWSRANTSTIALNPQNLVLPRLQEAGAKDIDVKALYDTDRLSLLLEWKDAHRDTDLGTVLQYRDAVAIQFPEDPSLGPTSFTMGQEGGGVVIYHWKSDWQFGQLYDVDEAYPNMYGDWYQYSGVEAGKIPEATDYLTKGQKEYLTAAAVNNALADPQIQNKIGPIQKLRAEGFGTLEPDETQDAQGMGAWSDGGWRIVISVPRKQAKFTVEEAAVIPLAFAVWDGSRDERNGQKAYSQWNEMKLIPATQDATRVPVPSSNPIGGNVVYSVLGAAAAVLAVTVGALISLRMRSSRSQGRKQ